MNRNAVRIAVAALALSVPAALVAAQVARAQAGTTATAQAVDFPVNLNTATDAEILAIPNTGPRMLREFKEYRPYVNVEQFRRELGKYVSQVQVTRWLEYAYVPTNPNTATIAQLTALKGVDRAMADFIVANRSYAGWDALKAALVRKYDAKTVAAVERYWVFK